MTGHSLDLAAPGKDGLSVIELERFLDEMRSAPAWRTRADLECNYYDGNQHSPEDIQLAAERGLPIVTVNLIAPTINLVIGMEARTRTDWVVKPDGSQGGLTAAQADGLSALLNEAERNSYADQACADAYASQCKSGIGWVEVAKCNNPFEYPYRVCEVDRREIWWDMRGRDRLLRESRWLMRKKWHDTDVLEAMLGPEKKSIIDAAMNAESHWDHSRLTVAFPYLQDDLISRDWWGNVTDWRDTDRRRACAYEVWYRKWVRGWVLKFQNGRVVELDKKNPIHQAAIVQGMAVPELATYHKMRCSWWLGPFRLFDYPSPYSHNDFPYTPFWGYLEDDSRTPYGMIRSMKSLQDEVNARRAKMMWQLSAVRTIVEEDAVKDHNAVANEVGRPDAYIMLNKNRRPRSTAAIEITEHEGLNAQQFQVYGDAKKSLQQAGGIYSAMLGDGDSGAEAGVAIDQLIQQGTTALAHINSNYKLGRKAVGQKLLMLRLGDMKGQETKVDLGKKATHSRSVTFNKRAATPEGLGYIQNDVAKMMWKVDVADQPASPTHNQQRLIALVEYAKGLPPELQVVFADIVIEASDLPNKDQIAERIRKLTNQQPAIDPETATPEELEEAMQAKAAEDQTAAQQAAAMKAEMDKIVAETENTRADTALTRATTIEKVTALNLVPMVPEPAEAQASELEGVGEGGMEGAPGVQASPEDIQGASQDAMALEQDQALPSQDRVPMGAEMGL